MMKWKVLILAVFFLGAGWVYSFRSIKPVLADEDCLSNPKDWPPLKLETCLTELAHLKALSEAATAPLESEIKNLGNRINALQAGINAAVAKQKKLEMEVADREEKVAEHYVLFGKKIRELYKSMRGSSLLVQLLSRVGAGRINREIEYQGTASDVDKQLIVGLSGEILSLETTKKNLEAQKIKLASLQETLNKQAEFYKGEVATAKAYQATLQEKLSALQQRILDIKGGAFTASVGDSELADDYNASIKGFRESAPSGYFAVFSFGAYTHRKGMSQYGARGRAQNGEDYRKILKAYYGKEPVSKDTGGTISVAGVGNVNFEDYYLMGIAEVPSTWHIEVLRTQAVAARTYAYRYKIEGKQICTTETCQVFRKSKADSINDSKYAAWKQAVQDTRGQVLEDVVTYYSSTAGVYLTTLGWDTIDGGGGGNFVDKSYEKVGGSPWVYKAWYTKEYSPNSAKCGRDNPWLSPEEMADILNAALVLTKGTSGEMERISPVTTSCWGGNPYSHEELRNVASKYGGINSASSVSVQQGQGETLNVTVNGLTFSGTDFKKAFTLRAPGYLSVPQKGFAFYNIERK